MRISFRLSKLSIAVLLLAAISSCSDHGDPLDEYLIREVIVNGQQYTYRVLLPARPDPGARLPVMLYLHGSGARGDDNQEQIDGFRWAIMPVKEKINFIVVLPQCRPETFWASKAMADYAIAALDATIKEFNGDPERAYLAGFSLGGYGTWQIAAAYPGKFAALVPVAGGVVGERPIDPKDRAVIIPEVGAMLDSPEPYDAVAKAIGRTPVWVFHGTTDDAVPVDFARTIVKALKNNGNDRVIYTEYLGDGHQIFGKAIAEPGMLDWLSQQKLDKATWNSSNLQNP